MVPLAYLYGTLPDFTFKCYFFTYLHFYIFLKFHHVFYQWCHLVATGEYLYA